MEMCFEDLNFQEVKQKAIEIYQSDNKILDFKIVHKRDSNKWIVRFNIPNDVFINKFMLDK